MKPYITCHMVISMDGKATGSYLWDTAAADACSYYYRKHADFHADAFLCGRVTMESSFTNEWYPDLAQYQPVSSREDFIVNEDKPFHAVAMDRRGRLGWKDACIHDEDPGYDQAYIIEVLCEDLCDDRYLSYLRHMDISYIFAGKRDMDLKTAMDKLSRYFQIDQLLLEGGPVINEAFLKEDLIDAVSLVIAPVTADSDSDAVFHNSTLKSFTLNRVESEGSTVYLLYAK